MPCSGHRSSAATSASCASSSASPTSPTSRVSAAITRADSIRQTASMAPWMSDGSTLLKGWSRRLAEGPSSSITRRCPWWSHQDHASHGRSHRLFTVGGLGAEPVLGVAQLGGERGSEVLGLEHLPHLDLAALERNALHPLDRLILRLRLDQPEPGDQLLGLGERSVHHGALGAGELDPRAFRARLQPLRRQQHTRLHQLFVEPAHFGQYFLAGQYPSLAVLVGFHDQHEPHDNLLDSGGGRRTPVRPTLPRRRMAFLEFDTAQPPAMAPTTRYGSAPLATASGRSASGGSCVRSCSQAKKRRKGRRA